MPPITFTQLLAAKLFEIPLPANDRGGRCRECGGPIEEGAGLYIGKDKEYGKTWVDEGIIAFNASTTICPHCQIISQGSTTRSTTIPPMGMVLLVTPDKIFPDAELLRAVWEKRGTKKDLVYGHGLTMYDFLQKLPNVPTPFGLVIGSGGLNDKHFFRTVPLNFNVGDSLVSLLMADYRFLSFRWKPLLKAIDAGLKQDVLSLPKGKRGDQLTQLADEHDLTGTESKLLVVSLLGLQ